MTAKLPTDLQKALRDAGEQPLEFLEPESGTIYVLIPKEQVVTRDDIASIQKGVDQLNMGQGRSIDESKADLAKRLGFNVPQ